MNAFDLLVLALVGGAAIGGYRLGLVARATSWLGMALGVAVAARFVPGIVERMEGADGARLLLVAAGLLLGGAFIGQAVGLVIGARLHYALPSGRARQVDRASGAAAGAIGVLLAVWLLAPAMAQVPGETARLARTSTIVDALATVLPPPPDTLRSLETLVGTDFPNVLDAFEPAPDLGPPPDGSGISEALQNEVATRTVKVEALACGRIQDGSGSVVAAPDIVLTNAHVVAGAEDISVERHPDGRQFAAELIAFDPRRDVAVLRVPGLERQPLGFGTSAEGTVGAVFGHPGGGPLELSPFQIGREVTATGRDIYQGDRTERQVLFLASELRPGDSGAALVDPNGLVVGLAFAIAPDDPFVAYALTVGEVQAVLAGPLQPTDPGPCLR